MFLKPEDIDRADDSPILSVDMTEYGWGGEVGVKTLNGEDRRAIERLSNKLETKEITGIDWVIEVAALSLCDESGKRLYTSDKAKKLYQRKPEALKHVVDKSLDHNGLLQTSLDDEIKN